MIVDEQTGIIDQRAYFSYLADRCTQDRWLEIMPLQAAKQLQHMLGCDWLVVFGDGKNDLDLFAIADQSYAVDIADPSLKPSPLLSFKVIMMMVWPTFWFVKVSSEVLFYG